MKRTLSNRRRYLTEDELKKLIKAGRKNRYGRRDATLMLLMARHGLRVTEAIDLRWDQTSPITVRESARPFLVGFGDPFVRVSGLQYQCLGDSERVRASSARLRQ